MYASYMSLFGIIVALLLGAFTWYSLEKLNQMEKMVKNRKTKYSFVEIDEKWTPIRFLVTLEFALFLFEWGLCIAEFIGYHPSMNVPIGRYFFHFTIVCFAIIGLCRFCWFLARLWLKRYAPEIYETYKPYYHYGLRQSVKISEVEIKSFTV